MKFTKFLKLCKGIYATIETVRGYNHILHQVELSPQKFNQVQASLNDAKEVMDKYLPDPFPQSNAKLTDVVQMDLRYIKAFFHHKFEECLEIALQFNGLDHALSVSRGLDALMELKARLPREHYNQSYRETETILKAQANSLQANAQSYDGTNMALAYGEYLDGNFSEMNFYFNRQKEIYGAQRIFKEENSVRLPWYYHNVSSHYIHFLTKLMEQEVNSNKRSQAKIV